MRNSILRLVCLTALLTGGAAVVPSAVAAAPDAQPELRVISWNICGEAGGDPGSDAFCPYRADPQRKADEVAAVVTAHDANVVLLQEVCGGEQGSQLDLLAATLGSEWTVRHAVVRRPDSASGPGTSHCRDKIVDGQLVYELKGDLGVAIAVKATVTETQIEKTVPLTGDLQQLPLLCVRTAQWTTRICTTHVLANPADPRRQAQIDKIETLTEPYRHDIVLGGDFNLFPDSTLLGDLEATYDECDRRAYTSGDPIDEYTHMSWDDDRNEVWRKRDHIFAARPGAGTLFRFCDVDQSRLDRSYHGIPSPTGNSDHAPVIGYLRTRTPGATTTPGDLTGDGRQDLLAIDDAGQLRLYEGRGNGSVAWPNGIIGTGGWRDAVISHRGDFTGDGTEDVLARIGDVLWLYPNRGFGRLGSRIPLGSSGWSGVTQVLSVGDLTGDGYPDVVAVRSGQLFLYAGDPARKPALQSPVLIGTGGWTPMTLTAPGDATGDSRPDLLAREKNTGVLYLYRGRDGYTFGDRTVFGTGGWIPTNRPLLAAGDADGNGIADLWATAGDGTLKFYAGATDGSGNPVDGVATQVGNSGWNTITAMS